MKKKILLLSGVILVIGLISSIAIAQNLSVDIGESTTRTAVQLILLLTVLSLAPSILIMITSFTRIIVVLSLLRTALGVQQTPPNTVLIGLALFLTAFIMAPTFQTAWENGILPYIDGELAEEEAIESSLDPFRTFMLGHTREEDLRLFVDMAGLTNLEGPDDVPTHVIIPSFMISELRRAFEIGFLLFLPFLIIDLTIASLLMSMGMMMVPPVIVSLPFKIVFFVLVDGWHMVAGSLVQGYSGGIGAG
ncbi:MAG: flagellar type III secretion system pore protein FliP [Pseudomonadota bacterium]